MPKEKSSPVDNGQLDPAASGDNAQVEAGHRLLAFLDRFDALELQIKALQDLKKEIYIEAKKAGFEKNILQEVVRRRYIRKANPGKILEQSFLVQLYEAAIERAEKQRSSER